MNRNSAARRVVRGAGLLMATVGSAYLFWTAALCEREDVDLVERPIPRAAHPRTNSLAGPVTFSADLDIPFAAGPRTRSTLFQRFAARNHPSRILRPLNTWFHGETRYSYGIPARIPWVRLTVRGMLALSCLLTAILVARRGWLSWQFSLKAMFIFVTLTAISCWAHGQLSEDQQLQPNRDLAWAVGMATIGGIMGAWLGNGRSESLASNRLPATAVTQCMSMEDRAMTGERTASSAIRVVMTLAAVLASTALFWAAARCAAVDVDLVDLFQSQSLSSFPPLPVVAPEVLDKELVRPASSNVKVGLYAPDTFSTEFDIPFRQGAFAGRHVRRLHPDRMLTALNDRIHGPAELLTVPTDADVPWVRLTVRALLTLACLLAAFLAARLGWLTPRISLRTLFAAVTLAAIGCWLHGLLAEGEQLQLNRDLAWAVGMAAIGMAAGFGAGNRRPRTTEGGPQQATASQSSPDSEALDQLVARITPENVHAEVDFGPPVGNETW